MEEEEDGGLGGGAARSGEREEDVDVWNRRTKNVGFLFAIRRL